MTEDDLQEDQPEETIYFTTYVYLTGLFLLLLRSLTRLGRHAITKRATQKKRRQRHCDSL